MSGPRILRPEEVEIEITIPAGETEAFKEIRYTGKINQVSVIPPDADTYDIEIFREKSIGTFGIYGVIQETGSTTFITERYIVEKVKVRARRSVAGTDKKYAILLVTEFGI